MAPAKPSNKLKTHVSCNYCQLTHLCLPKDFSTDELADLNAIIEQDYVLRNGDLIVHPNEPFQFLYAIRSGSFKEYTIDMEGKERVIDFYLPGEIIGLDAISQNKYNYPTIALENSIVCKIAFSNLLALTQTAPKLQYRLLNLISQKLLERTLINNHQHAEQRVAAFLINLSKRFADRGCSAIAYHLSMSRNDIGNYLNLTTETVSRTFSKFKSEGIITISNKHIAINNPKALQALVA